MIEPPPPHRTGPRRPRSPRNTYVAVGVFVVVLITMQVFLLTVGLDAWHAHDTNLVWVTALFSVMLAGASAAFYRYLR